MFVPVFTLNLNQKILPGRVAIGEFDGKHPCLAAATTAEKVFIHNPHRAKNVASGRMESSKNNQELYMLNIQQRVTALAAGKLNPDSSAGDALVIGTPTNLLAYDVENNSDLFYKDVPDGVNAIAIGNIGGVDSDPLAIVGGNCSLQGFDHKGNDPFWTVTGDNVSALTIMDYNNNGRNELIVGSEDYEIRIFSQDEILTEITETEAVTALVPIQEGRFGYALANGTVGVYEKTTRWWRIKSKNSASAIFGYDLDGDGVKELITGWSNGKLDARNDRSGEVIFKDNFNHSIAGLVAGDYRMDGKMELIACGSEGEIRGYLPSAGDIRRGPADMGMEQDSLRELSQKKSTLMLELNNYAQNKRLAGSSGRSGAILARGALGKELGVIPAQTQLSTSLAINLGTQTRSPHVEVSLSTSNDTIIRGVLIFAEGIFEGECHVLHPKEPNTSIHVPIFPSKDIPIDLHIKAFVGYNASQHFHVFELTRQLPRFSMYCRLVEPSNLPPPQSWVEFHINERTARVALWLNQTFLMGDDLEPDSNGILTLAFSSLRVKNQELHIQMKPDGTFKILCDNMDICGDMIQSLAEYLAVDDLKSSCDFPLELGKMENLLEKAEELQSVRQRLSAEMADNSGMIRTLIVRAEDSRLMLDMKTMRNWYSQLNDINRDMISGYKIRCNNHEELMESLKLVNQIIQKSGRLRVGKSKASVISHCREAIKDNNPELLLKVIRTGDT
eukprot:maker-scaffold865_size87005-snap-gene-0.23 protein:Tk05469 transcript:maker-scaffold865_size87005-snap-gene-0.23-mRNA-1 annotation:"bardet-biedl syndrome 2 protein homolog"